MNTVTIPEAVKIAVRHHQAGQLDMAGAIYRQILQQQPGHPDALHLLGAIYLQNGNHAAAAELIGKAIAVAPNSPDFHANYGEALRSLGRDEEAIAACGKAIALNPHQVSAYNNLGLALKDAGRLDEAIDALRQAVTLKPDHHQAHNNLATALMDLGDAAAAIDSYRKAIAFNPAVAEMHYNLGVALRTSNRPEEAVAALREAVRLKPNFRDAFLALVELLEIQARQDTALGVPEETMPDSPRQDLPLVSIIICSIDPAKFARVAKNFSRLLAGQPFEIIAIHDARSLAEGYNRGIDQSSGSILIFCHDDIEILAPDFGVRLRRCLENHDIVGVAGTTRLIGESWTQAGWPHLHGQVAHFDPQRQSYKVCVYGVPAPTVPGVQALDGLFFAVRRKVADALRFDEANFDGFHFYDLDFTYSAHLTGFRLAVCNEFTIVHHSSGNYGEAWERYAECFLEKYRGRLPLALPGEGGYPIARLKTENQVRSLHGLLQRLGLSAGTASTAPETTIAEALQSAFRHYQANRLQLAGAVCRQVLQHEPDQSDALNLLGIMAYRAQHLGTAEEMLHRAATAKPGDAVLLGNLGSVLRALGRLDEAAVTLRQALTLQPGYPEALASLGFTLDEMGKGEEASACFEHVLAADPHHAGVLDALARLRKAAGREEDAEQYRKRIKALAGDGDAYRKWVKKYDTVGHHGREILKNRVAALARKPLISVLMPAWNTPEDYLRRAIESVIAQAYPHWELCIADDASSAMHVRAVLEEYCRRDSRIKVAYRTENGHISAASNSALELASGEYLALLDHDDELPANALYCVALEVSRHPEAALIYSDEDKLDAQGRRCDPYFKPDWNPDLFLSQNMVSHLGVYRTEVVRRIGGFREGLEGSQDYDLALRVMEQIRPGQVRHIPKVLYHWRMTPGSTSLSGNEKPYAFHAAVRALNEHLLRNGGKGEATDAGEAAGMYRVRRAIPAAPPLVTLIVPTRNGLELLRTCVQSIVANTRYPSYEILIVDNGSDDPATLAYLGELEKTGQARVLRDERPFNFAALNNRAVEEARGDIVGLLNNDIEAIGADWLEEMVSHALRPEIGAVGARLWFPNDTLQHGGVILVGGVADHAHRGLRRGNSGYGGRAALLQNFSAVTAACLVLRKELYLAAGGMDERLAIAFNDVDFCLRLNEMGYRNLWTPYAELYHHESASRGHEDTPAKRARFAHEVELMQERWGDLLRNDPAYNPNLTLESVDFALAWPPRVQALCQDKRRD